MKYPKFPVVRKSGSESFHKGGQPIGIDLRSFWQWSCSDLVNNAMRGILAEYIVASAVRQNKTPRVEWDAYDIVTKEGIKIEVKSASYLQSWSQEQLSRIQFSIKPTYGWDAQTNTRSKELKRHSDIYVFCVLNHKVQETLDPLNLEQWNFYILPTVTLTNKAKLQKTITLSRLMQFGPIISTYEKLYKNIQCLFLKDT